MSQDVAVTCFIRTAAFESAVADAIFTRLDDISPLTTSLGHASLVAGRLLSRSWRSDHEGIRRAAGQLADDLDAVPASELPAEIWTAESEGYAHYGVYPESYLRAAARSAAWIGSRPVLVIGLRSIGASLSAAVAGALAEDGHEVERHTVRPRGDPFDRRLALDSALSCALASAATRGAAVLLVDEGPGLSGSSFVGTALALEELGLPRYRIALMPSWETTGDHLKSPRARALWSCYRQFTVTADELDPAAAAARELAGTDSLRDLSAGQWRSLVYPGSSARPAVQPQHERRKFLAQRPDAQRPDRAAPGSQTLVKFLGLGGRAERLQDRARLLAGAGFSPAPLGALHGMVAFQWVAGTPCRTGGADAALVGSAARYLSAMRELPTCGSGASSAELSEMIDVNVEEGLGPLWRQRAEQVLAGMPREMTEQQVALDGRMLAHEWFRSPARGWLKADSLEHHADHFFPGGQDVAWDVAGACVELLPPTAGDALVEAYCRTSGDHAVTRRLPFYALAYLAFRLGYSTMAAESDRGSADGARFRREIGRYGRLLRRELSRAPGRPWSWQG